MEAVRGMNIDQCRRAFAAYANGWSASLPPILEEIRIGVDPGQVQDPTAILVAEVERRDWGFDYVPVGGELHFVVRRIERLPLHTPYQTMAKHVLELRSALSKFGQGVPVWTFVDATGVGRPVVELLGEAAAELVPVCFTGADSVSAHDGAVHLGKALMVSRLRILLDGGRLHVSDSTEGLALRDELLAYDTRVSEGGHTSFGAFATGAHDDLVTALGLACYFERSGGGAVVTEYDRRSRTWHIVRG